MHFDTKKLTRCALIAAIYVALTMLSNALNLAYGPIQLRFSEAMTVLPFLMPEQMDSAVIATSEDYDKLDPQTIYEAIVAAQAEG